MSKENDLYIKPSSDIFIKYLFGMDTEESRELLLSFINAVLQDAGFEPVVSVISKNPFNYKEFITDKESILDIDAKDEQGREYNIEVQTSGDTSFRNRSLYYWANLYNSQLEESERYQKLNPVICINILDFVLFPELPQIHNYFMIIEGIERQYILTNHLIIHFIELSKIKTIKTTGKINKWLLFLKYEGSNEKMIKTLLEGDEDMGKAHVKYVNFTHNSDMRRLYRARLKAHRDAQYRLDMATDQGLAKGLAKGREEGIKKGICDAKRSDLIRLMDLKYGLTANEETFISSISDLESLNSAMDKIIISESKVQVLEVLKKNL